ncbi:MAG: hypothetical protein ACREAA_02020 [Candidatus Polarisedimenticolia bacterium]
MSFDVEKLFSLLPAVYRIRDIRQGEQLQILLSPDERAELVSLRALPTLDADQEARRLELEARQYGFLKGYLSIIAEQTSVLEENLEQLYDDLFIETCAEWIVPYIGDLVGVRGSSSLPGALITPRAFVANTMAYRRRKGTATVLEQLARDLTGWHAAVVEYFKLLATTQYLNHLRPENLSFAPIRDARRLERVGSPFDPIARTADVRRIEPRRGRYNIPHIGLHLYRLGSFPLTDAPAFQVDSFRYRFDALGKDIPLFNRPEAEGDITHLAEPGNVPSPLTRRVLHRDLALHYGTDRGFAINVNGTDVPLVDIAVCDLSDIAGTWAHMPTSRIAIDPELGRIALSAAASPLGAVRVNYHYGFGDSLGGGEYARTTTFGGTGSLVKVPDERSTLQEALDEVASPGGIVEVSANGYFLESPIITAGTEKGTTIELRAAEGRRPVLVVQNEILVVGADQSEVTLNGLLIAGGRLRVPATDGSGNPNRLRRLTLVHCTLAAEPQRGIGGIPAETTPVPRLVIELPEVSVKVERSILGEIRAVDGAEVVINDSIVDAGAESRVAFAGLSEVEAGAPLVLEDTTVIGRVRTLTMTMATNTIFLADGAAPVVADRVQSGCVRFSFVPSGSRLPKQHRCQPASAADAGRVRPVFTSLRYGDPGYCQLSQECAAEIREGADDGAEIGAFHDLQEPQREAALRASLDEYLRFGLEAGIFFAS